MVDGMEYSTPFPGNVTVRVGETVHFVLGGGHNVAFLGRNKTLADYPSLMPCPDPYNREPYNESLLTAVVCFNPYILFPAGNPNVPYDGSSILGSGWYNPPAFGRQDFIVKFAAPGSYQFCDTFFLFCDNITVVAASDPVPRTEAQVLADGDAMIAAARATKASTRAKINAIAESNYLSGSVDGHMQYNIMAGYQLNGWYIMRFLPERIYEVHPEDVVSFTIPLVTSPAPHIISFMNGNAPFLLLGPKTTSPNNVSLGLPWTNGPFVALLNTAMLFPQDPVVGLGGTAFAPYQLRSQLSATGIYTSGFLTGFNAADATARWKYEWKVNASALGRTLMMECQFHPFMGMENFINVTAYSGPAAPTVYHATMYSYAAEGNLTGNTGTCTDYNYLVEMTLKPYECKLLGESYPFMSYVMAVPVKGPTGSQWTPDKYVQYIRYDLFNTLPPCTLGLVVPGQFGIPAPGTNCILPLDKSCAPCGGIVQLQFSKAAQTVVAVWALLMALLALLN